VLLAVPLAYGGYTFLRDDELEPYTGTSLLIRAIVTSLIYAGLWGIFALLRIYVFPSGMDLMILAMVVVPIVAVGAAAAYGALDLSFGAAALHFGLYAGFTLILCVLMQIDVKGDPTQAPRRKPRQTQSAPNRRAEATPWLLRTPAA
jgi:hypothetical protein